jgi:hypothetical protein
MFDLPNHWICSVNPIETETRKKSAGFLVIYYLQEIRRVVIRRVMIFTPTLTYINKLSFNNCFNFSLPGLAGNRLASARPHPQPLFRAGFRGEQGRT